MKISTVAAQGSLNESTHGNVIFKYAVVDLETGKTVSPWFQCRDYMNDIVWSYKRNASISIYGFSCKGDSFTKHLKKDRLCIATKLVAKHVDQSSQTITDTHVVGLATLIHSFDSALGFNESQVEACEENRHVIVTVDMAWTQSPYILSTLLLLLRLGYTYDPAKDVIEQYSNAHGSKFISPHDVSYFSRSVDVLKSLLLGRIDESNVWPDENVSNYTVHNQGIVQYAQSAKAKVKQ